MATRRPRRASKPRLVRKTVTVDAAQLAKARRVLNIRSDAEVLRYALEHLVAHFEPHDEEEQRSTLSRKRLGRAHFFWHQGAPHGGPTGLHAIGKPPS